MAATEVASLLDELRAAVVYDLEQPRYGGAPTFAAHTPGFLYSLHRRHEDGLEARTSASGLIVAAEHSGTHIDALCHQAVDMEMHGGIRVNAQVQTSVGFTQLGVETIPPMIARGVLLDAARHDGLERFPPEYHVSGADLERAVDEQGVSIDAGDVVLIRTGNGALWEDPAEYARGPGIGTDASRWLSEQKLAAVGADNLAWDPIGFVDPEVGSLPGHVLLIVRNGVHIIENLFLESLSRARCYEFIFVCLPLKMRGVTGSPVRPLAIVPRGGG